MIDACTPETDTVIILLLVFAGVLIGSITTLFIMVWKHDKETYDGDGK